MIGIIAAMNPEYALFKTKENELFNGAKYKIVKSGIGPNAAADAALDLIKSGCDTIIGWGFAGGLSEKFKCGQLIIANRFATEDEHYYSPTPLQQEFTKRLDSLNPNEGIIFTTDRPILKAKEKQMLAKRFGSVAVDMESLGIISVTKQKAVPYLSIRVILDDSKTTLPTWISHLLKENKSSRRAILLSKQLFKPGELYSLIKLAFLYKRAAKKLNRISNLLAK
tara:strand:- start:1099 stop:1770 length:672 start_codon:yes stop_codon:yes gene_type:complete